MRMSRNPNYRYLRELQVSQRCSHRNADIICLLVELNHHDVSCEVQGVLHGLRLLFVWSGGSVGVECPRLPISFGPL